MPMTDFFVFHEQPPLQTLLNAFGTQHGTNFVGRTANEFASLTDVLHHTQQVGAATVVHEPDGGNVVFTHVPRSEFARAAYLISGVNGFPLF
jgi:hypothetical protein